MLSLTTVSASEVVIGDVADKFKQKALIKSSAVILHTPGALSLLSWFMAFDISSTVTSMSLPAGLLDPY